MNPVIRKWMPAILLLVSPSLTFAENGQKMTYDQIETFLKTADIVKMKNLSTGVTSSRRATMSDGTLTHDAHVQTIDESKAKFEGDRGTEINFVDSWKYNIAAYRLSRILGLDMVPVSVERKINGVPSAVTWWLDNSMMETDRISKKLTSPHADDWNREMYIVRVFDQLIYNMDRNLQNLLIDPDWHIWMIDHTRAFRLYSSIKEKKNLVQCDRQLLTKLRGLDNRQLQTLKPYLNNGEIRGLLGRRDKIVEFFDQEVQTRGENSVLYDRPTR